MTLSEPAVTPWNRLAECGRQWSCWMPMAGDSCVRSDWGPAGFRHLRRTRGTLDFRIG